MEGRRQIFSSQGQVTVMELRRLLLEIRDLRPDIGIRFRLLGKMWYPNFLNVFVVSESAVVLVDQTNKTAQIITQLSSLIQFELDSRFRELQPYFHYAVTTDE